MYRKNQNGVRLIGLLWTTCYVLWYVASPTYRGPISILKSVDRSPIQKNTVRNWGDTKSCKPDNIIKVKNIDDIMNVMDHERIRVAGGGHSWSPLICSNDTVVSLDFCKEPSLVNNIVTVDAGCKIEDVSAFLQKHNRVLHGFGGIQYQTIGGSIMTSLHGSQYVGFSSNVVNMTAVLSNKSIVSVKGETLKYWKSSMGMLGIVYNVSLQTFPVVSLNKTCKLTNFSVALDSLKENHFGATLESFWGMYQNSVQLCTYNDPIEENLKYKTGESRLFSFVYDNVVLPSTILLSNAFRAFDLTRITHSDSTERLSILDAWKIVSGYGFVSAEYSVPLNSCSDVVKEIQDTTYPYIVAVYIRRLNASTELLSFATVDSCVIDISFADYQLINTYEEMKKYHVDVEKIINRYNGSTHWGKYYGSNISQIKVNNEFKEYRNNIDPLNKFMNSYTEELITGVPNENGQYDDPAIHKNGTMWKAMWWTTFGVTILSSIWYVSKGGYRKKLYIIDEFYLDGIAVFFALLATIIHLTLDHTHLDIRGSHTIVFLLIALAVFFVLKHLKIWETRLWFSFLFIYQLTLVVLLFWSNLNTKKIHRDEQDWAIVASCFLLISCFSYIHAKFINTDTEYDLLR
jgi:FAD/FMN-containing dehydrogenase